MILTRATREGIRGNGIVSNGHVVQWVSLTGRTGVPQLPRPVPPGVKLVVYLESHLDEQGYRDLLAGKYDAELARLSAALPADAIVRWDHEMTSPPNAWRTWGQMDRTLYVKVWRYVWAKLGRQMFWCPSGHKVDDAYFPGHPWVQFVGFTSYELGIRNQKWGTPQYGQRFTASQLWRKPLAAVRALAPGVPIVVGETGSLDDDTGDRLPWVRSVKRVKGVDIVIGFDVDMTKDEGRDWTFSGAMVAEWET